MAACDGADRLQAEQCSLVARMSLAIPGQNTIDLARDSMDDTPWCAEWRIRRTLSRKVGGTTTRSRYKMTPSVTLSESRYVQNAAISSFAHGDHLGSPLEQCPGVDACWDLMRFRWLCVPMTWR